MVPRRRRFLMTSVVGVVVVRVIVIAVVKGVARAIARVTQREEEEEGEEEEKVVARVAEVTRNERAGVPRRGATVERKRWKTTSSRRLETIRSRSSRTRGYL
jgi:hypothetical protein